MSAAPLRTDAVETRRARWTENALAGAVAALHLVGQALAWVLADPGPHESDLFESRHDPEERVFEIRHLPRNEEFR